MFGILERVDISDLCVKKVVAKTEIPDHVLIFLFWRRHEVVIGIVYALDVAANSKLPEGGIKTDIPAEEVVVAQSEIHAHTRKNVEVEDVSVDIMVIENQRIVFG